MRIKDRTAVVTGAAGGIGRAIALSLAKRGCHLALCDINELGLAETVSMARAHGVKVSGHRLDVADRHAVMAFPVTVKEQHPGVDILVNNAGVAVGGTFEQVSEADFEWLFDINFWGVVRMTRAFLPLLKASDEARIVNLSSIFGIIAPPGQTAYSASKFAVRGFSNALRHEFETSGARIGVTVVHPGGVATSIAENSRAPAGVPDAEIRMHRKVAKQMLTMPPEMAGEIIVGAVERDKARVLVGRDAKLAAFLEWLFPVSYWRIMERRRQSAIQKAMRD
jgi:NAD(P)-dependent dehydrogenase (short-subunit alcohol dehydrogenase family)